MRIPPDKHRAPDDRPSEGWRADAPPPSPLFRRRAWRDFQRALDPLAPPKPLPTRPPQQH